VVINGKVKVADEIIRRLRDVNISLAPYVGSKVTAKDTVLKGIDFRARDLGAIKRAFDTAVDNLGRRAFYTSGRYGTGNMVAELIRNAPVLLDMSFAATDGYGYREIRDMPLVPTLRTSDWPRMSASFNSRFGFGDEREAYYEITSLHAELGAKKCNIHIDTFGFVMRGPSGAFLTPDFLQHAVDELVFKEHVAPAIGSFIGRLFRVNGQQAGNWIARNVTLDLPSYRNSYRKGIGLRVTPTPNIEVSARFTAKCGWGTRDSRLDEPEGTSVAFGFTMHL
jgi:hypothetical protein